jgi:hypothetical protein
MGAVAPDSFKWPVTVVRMRISGLAMASKDSYIICVKRFMVNRCVFFVGAICAFIAVEIT